MRSRSKKLFSGRNGLFDSKSDAQLVMSISSTGRDLELTTEVDHLGGQGVRGRPVSFWDRNEVKYTLSTNISN